MRRRVVVTGIGWVTPLGADLGTVWNRLTEGRSGTRRLSLFDSSGYPVRIAAEVHDWSVAEIGENPRQWEQYPRQSGFALGAGVLAAAHAGLTDGSFHPLRAGVYLGCGEPFEDFHQFTNAICRSDADAVATPIRSDAADRSDGASAGTAAAASDRGSAARLFDPDAERQYDPNLPAIHLAGRLNLQGPNLNCIAACVSSAQAIGQSAAIIQRDEADIMLCGGAHSTIHPFGVAGFQRLGALSTRNDAPESAARPFDRERDGFVMGEGGAILVLEELSHARARGAQILAELTGYASTQDAFRVTDTHPEGRGIVTAARNAIRSAGLNLEDIGYVNAHGTGTALNDKVETTALKSIFGQHAYRVPVSSTKSMMGHATTACGAIEAAVCVLALRNGVIPPTINYATPDPDCDLDYVPNSAPGMVRPAHIE